MNARGRKYLGLSVLSAILLVINYVLLRDYNTLRWPYLWPQPALYILIGFFVIGLWFREYFSGIWALRVVGLCMVFIGES